MESIKKTLFYSIAVMGFSFLYIYSSPIISIKARNHLNETKDLSVIEREKQHFLEDFGENKSSMFDKAMDQGLTLKIINKFGLHDYKQTIEERVKDVPDVEKTPYLWMYLMDWLENYSTFIGRINNRNGTEIYSNVIHIYRDLSVNTLYHERIHTLGDSFHWEPSNIYKFWRLNEGLTDYYADLFFGLDFYEYEPEVGVAKRLYDSVEIMKKELDLSYDPLAKAFFVDRSMNDFESKFNTLFGNGAFENFVEENFRKY